MALREYVLDMFNLRKDRTGFFRAAPDAVPVISQARALDVFDTLKNMDNIAYNYTDDGCYARTHLMCRNLFGAGLVPEKAWAFETDNRELIVKFPHGEQTWWFHVAPVLNVDDGKGGYVPMVFDPSLFDGPVTLKEWGDIMQAEENQIFIAPCGKAPGYHRGDYTPYHRTGWATDNAALSVMDEYVQLQKEQDFTPHVFPSQMRNAANDERWNTQPAAAKKTGGQPCRNQKA
jgi:hypothetical protein